jgi:hypothetical protein
MGAISMFVRDVHQRVLAVLQAMRTEVLRRCHFLFGGGTRIVLDLEEYRVSKDIDFLCSDPQGFADLRYEASRHGYPALFTAEGLVQLRFPREMRIDQYGIRFTVVTEGSALGVELIREARIELDSGVRPSWSPVDCLSFPDCFAEKLLASSDRWADRQFLSRDLIDLAALRLHCGPIPETAWRKVEAAYKSAAATDLRKALDLFRRDEEEYRQRAFRGLEVLDPEKLLKGVELLLDEIHEADSLL